MGVVGFSISDGLETEDVGGVVELSDGAPEGDGEDWGLVVVVADDLLPLVPLLLTIFGEGDGLGDGEGLGEGLGLGVGEGETGAFTVNVALGRLPFQTLLLPLLLSICDPLVMEIVGEPAASTVNVTVA